MTAIGETLRRERLRRNLDLETVSRELKISPKLLDAIESEKFDRLPGGVFAKAFVRQYAHYLGLDEEEMAAEVQRILQPALETTRAPEGRPAALEPIPLPKVEEWQSLGDRRQWGSTLPALALVVVVMMGCAGVYSWWQRSRHSSATPVAAAPPQQTPAVAAVQPAAQQAEPNAQPAAPSSVQASPVAQPSNPAPQDGTGSAPPAATAQTQTPVASKPPAVASNQPVTPAQPPVAAKQALPADAAQPSNPNAAVRVELLASEPVWVLVRSDGKYLFSGTIEPNQSRMVEANSTITLRLGNAGGVNITLNGKPIGTVGPKGQVRTVQLTSGGFEIVAAPKPSGVPLGEVLR